MDDAIQEDPEAINFKPIIKGILKWLRFKFQIFSLAQQWFGIGDQGSEIILRYIK
jgi:hypothetical protein